jgi:hypothetical protein
MASNSIEISVKGKWVRVPALNIGEKNLIVTGNWIKMASIHDEDWLGKSEFENPDSYINRLKENTSKYLKADIFTFTQKPPETTPKYSYPMEWDNIAAIPVTSFSNWWTKQVSSYLRRDVRKAAKLGVLVRPVTFTDDLVRGIVDIYNETPIRQGKPFLHYQKSFDAVKKETGTYLKRADFLGAFLSDELIGFLKLVYVDHLARLMQIISKLSHEEKNPTNALIAKAVELCEIKGCSHLTYGKYRYEGIDSTLTAFKHRNGFEEILIPKYYVPLTLKGSLALRLRLQYGPKSLVPSRIRRSLVRARASLYRHLVLKRRSI